MASNLAVRTSREAIVPPSRTGLDATTVASAIAVGALIVLAIWARNTPPTLHTLGDYLTNAGRITGLLAGYGVVVLLALMARIPALEHGLGADTLSRWHSIGGRYVVTMSTVHTVTIIWGYSALSHSSLVGQTSTLVLHYPDVLMATAALGLLLLVGVMSARAVRTKVRYETWYLIHFYTYLAIALAFSHQFSTGAEFMRTAWARWFWSALYIGVGGLLLWYRFYIPLQIHRRHNLRVSKVVREAPGVVSILISGDDIHDLGAAPGQFFRWRFLTPTGWWQSHPFSLSAAPHPGSKQFRITVKDLGDHSRELQRVRPGTRVWAEGPYGSFTAARRTRRKVLLLAGGVGITPLRTLFETLPGKPGDILLAYRVEEEKDVLFRKELEQIATQRGHQVMILLGPPGGPKDPLHPQRLGKLIPNLSQFDVYVCGPPGMSRAAEASLERLGVPRSHIHTEKFEF